MTEKLKIRDLTMRDGQQSAFATRMKQSQIDRILPLYKEANFYALEVWGGAVPDSVMRYLGENPWTRLESIHEVIGPVSKLTALSRGRNLFGYAPYTDQIIDGFCRNAIESGLGIMRIFDALNDVDNVKSTIKYVKQYGGIADCAVCYTIDPKYPPVKFFDRLRGKKNPQPVFTDAYFLDKAKQMEALGADMITIKDMSGLIPPQRVSNLIKLFKQNLKVPVDFHTHCTPGYGLASVLAAIGAGVDVVDTNIWNFAGGPAAPAIELVWIFCQKAGVELDVNMEAVAKINEHLLEIRKELDAFDAVKKFPKPFNPLTDKLPAEIDAEFDRALKAVKEVDEDTLVDACHKIEAYFGFPEPNELVQKAEIPGGMYTNMVAQLKQLKSEDILEDAMKLIPTVRLQAGLPPLVTPTSQIVGAQAVNCAIDLKKGKPMYTTTSNQFVSMVKGEYGHTPVKVDPEFRLKIAGTREETPYDTSKYKMQPNPVLEDCGGVKLAENEKEELLLELFPMVAKDYLTKTKRERWEAIKPKEEPKPEPQPEVPAAEPIVLKGAAVVAPLPGTVQSISVKEGDEVKRGQEVLVLDAMKMENSIVSDHKGKVLRIFVEPGQAVAADGLLMEIGE
ncbi:MAG: biotin/lipoyl-binding protein [Tidjanibacter sp.]|nr:biotin/lipoyl-binding protein [Tidjanibacter sp.]